MKSKTEGEEVCKNTKDAPSKTPHTEPPLSEKDEEKKAEERTREAQKNVKKLHSD